MSSVPQTVLELVERFERNLEAYRSGPYNEAQVRREFIDPLFKALGWDVENVLGYAEAYKDVIHEDAIKIGGYTKAPDYCFRIGGARKFFVEAKKPSVRVKEEISPAYQLRRYAWSAKLPLSILTDFEEFAVYDCRVRPVVTDRASKARVLYMQYTDYAERWDEIATIFAKEAVLKGSFDKYAESTRRKRGTAEVDAAFLQEIDSWRDGLARNLALRNPSLTPRDLNYAVQRTIDRIIFLRICEDRGIEVYGRLLALVNGGQVYERLCDLYRQADERYNSGLFHFRHEKGRAEEPDELTPSLIIDDALLKGIIKSLYYPDSPYEFSVLPADILGQVYEQFLGKVIRLTPGHRAKVEYKPVVKKAGGVYYTPTYIVDYIVEHTVGELLKDSNPRKAARLRILDPACGSGSFLLGGYQRLLDWHRDWYVADGPESWAARRNPRLYQGHGGEWRLTTGERKRILLNNIYGVDIDSQAVEVTKLSLLLKVLEGESGETLRRQLAFFRERALPDLATNIKCGNSLIGSDFYEGQQMSLLDEEEIYRVNAFDWEGEFAEIMAGGGFDAVIGNPPYLKEYTYRQSFRDLRGTKLFKYYQGKMDIWYVFACLSIDLLRPGGLHSFIAQSNWITNSGASILRQKLLAEAQLHEFVDFGAFRVFQAAAIQTMIYVVEKTGRPHRGGIRYRRVARSKPAPAEVSTFLRTGDCNDLAVSFDAQMLGGRQGEPFTFVDSQTANVVRHIQHAGRYRLKREDVAQGIVLPQDFALARHLRQLHDKTIRAGDGIFVLSTEERAAMQATDREETIIKPYYTTRQLGRYYGDPHNDLWVIYTDSATVPRIADFPHIRAHLDKFKAVITSDNRPYGLHRARDERFFLGEKIVSLRKTARPHFTYTDFPCYVSQTFFVLKPTDTNLKYLVGILNSKVCRYWLDKRGKKQGKNLQIDKAPLLALPIRTIDFSDPADAARHDRMVALVERMLALHNQLAAAKTPTAKTALQRQIVATDRQIDRLVYELYNLTEEEIAIVEGAT